MIFIRIVIIFILLIQNIVFAETADKYDVYIQKLHTLEKQNNGKLGVVLLDHLGNVVIAYRANERFPMASTSKVMVVAAILKEDEKTHILDKEILLTDQMLVNYNPIVENNINKFMKIDELAAAAIQYSDNAAMNILLSQLGGPAAATQFARSIGDEHFQLDRIEPELNHTTPGDIRDTTTPLSMAKTLYRLTLGDVLSQQNSTTLMNWLKGNTTGEKSIKAGLPPSWVIGDKTGSGNYGTTNDIAIIWPENNNPFILTVYFTQNNVDASSKQSVLSEVSALLQPLMKK